MQKYNPTIGLEIHVELKTKTKMFCGCLNNPDEKTPNFNICPVCTGHPGVLPTINKEAIEKVLKLGIALSGEIGNPPLKESKFDRKNYFYPDLPKAYQISQYDQPLVLGGELNGIRIRRIHLEEDTARLLHATNNQPQVAEQSSLRGRQPTTNNNYSLVDFNRSSIPLMELVTEPDIKSGEEAVKFAKELQLILRYLGISDADMEKGHMRVEANISLMHTNLDTNGTNNIREIRGQIGENSRALGTKVEIKNLNSFRAVGDAIDCEIERQAEILEKGEKVVQETRGWDENKKQTISQRLKEEAHDYRYFPEPDLPSLDLNEFDLEKIKKEIIELPWQKRERFIKDYNLSLGQIEILTGDIEVADYFEKTAKELKSSNYKLLYNYFTSDLRGLMKENNFSIADLKKTPQEFAQFIDYISVKNLTSNFAKLILKLMFEKGHKLEDIIDELKLEEKESDDFLDKIAEEVISANPKAVEDFKKGQENALQFLIGQAMAKLKGRANPQELKEIFKQKI